MIAFADSYRRYLHNLMRFFIDIRRKPLWIFRRYNSEPLEGLDPDLQEVLPPFGPEAHPRRGQIGEDAPGSYHYPGSYYRIRDRDAEYGEDNVRKRLFHVLLLFLL